MKNLEFDPENWDWYAFLDASEEIKEEFVEGAIVLAGGWATCACGQVCNVLPRKIGGSPIDFIASTLGMNFFYEIKQGRWIVAKKTLDKIEARTIFLLKQPNFIDPKTL